MKTIVGMPAYNEAKYVGSIVLQSQLYADMVVVVDDGSSDDTAMIAERAGAHVVRHGNNRGYGSSIRSIMAEAKKLDADILVILDADSQHNPAEIPKLVKAITDGADLVIGSREMQNNDIAAYRRFGQRVLAKMTYVASREKVTDTESGFRAYSRETLNTLELKEKGMAISAEIVSEASRKGIKVTEVPISVTYTNDGSTLNPITHGLGNLSRIMVMISERRPLFFFGILGAVFLTLGVGAGLWVFQSYYSTGILATGTALVSALLVIIGLLSIFTGMILNVIAKRD